MTYQGANRRVLDSKLLDVATEGGKAGAKSVLIQLGVDVDNPLDMQADFLHVRNHRLGTEQFSKTAKRTLVIAGIGGTLTILAIGLKEYLIDILHLPK